MFGTGPRSLSPSRSHSLSQGSVLCCLSRSGSWVCVCVCVWGGGGGGLGRGGGGGTKQPFIHPTSSPSFFARQSLAFSVSLVLFLSISPLFRCLPACPSLTHPSCVRVCLGWRPVPSLFKYSCCWLSSSETPQAFCLTVHAAADTHGISIIV